ncbi:putative 26S proteasome non-ATPase regulatory subunit 13 [Blattamonas nauphoetae]|uniref:26S proteasome non-ATPase regulatory subunit 13 n=1 Tax=Blattamonas nauphoetae TaxID=2049346 RepID=A0ABQ9XIP9_9EUKA|nr:putative 26S proteasome non-ATPase regulatory subunit 13 [Blattamonas nauphoetae]
MDFTALLALKRKGFWTELTSEIEDFINNHSGIDLMPLYEQVIKGSDHCFNRLRWAQLINSIAASIPDPVAFLGSIRQSFSEVEREKEADAFDLITLCLAQNLQITNQGSLPRTEAEEQLFAQGEAVHLEGRELADRLVDEVKTRIESTFGIANATLYVNLNEPVEEPVSAMLHLVLAEKAQLVNDYQSFYTHMMQYLSRTPLAKIKEEKKIDIATNLCLAAIVCPDMYGFGELVSHPILASLEGKPNAWLVEFVKIFDEGNITQYNEFTSKYSVQLQSIPTLLNALSIILTKIRVMVFVSYVFSLSSNKLTIPFATIAQITQIPIPHVEILVLQTFGSKLLKGSIDQISEVVVIDDIKPRQLSFFHVESLEKKVATWGETVQDSLSFLQVQIDQTHSSLPTI